MTVMIGPLILIAAIAAPPATFRPVGGASARATASIRIVSGVSFGPGRTRQVSGATQRSTTLSDGQGRSTPAIILEFQ